MLNREQPPAERAALAFPLPVVHQCRSSVARPVHGLGFFELINAARQVFGDATGFSAGDASRSVDLDRVNFRDAAESAAMNMPRAIGTGIGDWTKGYAASKQKGHRLPAH